jgi:orotate phosphoribosyltransferase
MDVIKQQFIDMLTKSNALQYGDFILASGKKSQYYFDGKQVILNSKTLAVVARLMAFRVYEACPIIDAIGDPELRAVPLVGGVLAHWGITLKLWGYENDIRGFIVRKEPKGHGLKKFVEGPLDEDVTTTGGSAMKAVKAVEELGHQVKVVTTILDRQEGAHQLFEERGIKFIPLITAQDIVKPEVVPEWDNDYQN